MKKFLILILLILFAGIGTMYSRKPLDHSVYDSWKKIENVYVSPRGLVSCYEIQPQEGDGVLEIVDKRFGKLCIPRGNGAVVSDDERYLVCMIKPLFHEVRQARIKKKKPEQMPKDSLAVLSLSTAEVRKFGSVSSFDLAGKNPVCVAFQLSDTLSVSRSKKKKKDTAKQLVVINLKTNRKDTIQNVEEYRFDDSGQYLSAVVRDSSKHFSIWLYQAGSGIKQQLIKNESFLTLPVFDKALSKLVFLASKDTAETGSKHCSLIQYSLAKKEISVLRNANAGGDIPVGWIVNENSNPFFSENGKQLFVGIAPNISPRDTSIIPFETAELDLWNTSSLQLPPVQLKNLKKDMQRTSLAAYDYSSSKLMSLSTARFDYLTLLNQGNSSFVLSVDQTHSMIETQWNDQNDLILSLIDVRTGVKKTFAHGVFADVMHSPDGKSIVWFNMQDSQWYMYNVVDGRIICKTRGIQVAFADEDNDEPRCADSYGFAGWIDNGKAACVYDRYDVWALPCNGAPAFSLTSAYGRSHSQTIRLIRSKLEKKDRKIPFYPSEPLSFKSDETIAFSLFDRISKKNGFGQLRMCGLKPVVPAVATLDSFSFAVIRKAETANVLLYQKANFHTSPDLYITTDWAKTSTRLTDINPQMAEYLWGTAELVKWKAYDGTMLEGLLYKPEGFDPAKKYPLISYFYERNSEKLFNFYPPAPSRSTINISFYCSRGYLVFVPDIVYKVGKPGESAYNCIVSGVEDLMKKSWVDRDHMAIQGQSWGGYQVAYLVTRTNLFKAAGAGAPVANMTSAYGGIRWESGVSRQFQYEHTQSRIGKTLWEDPQAYIDNSPLFRAEKVNTPLLIMSNDADGAVPYYQGIEYFMALRRLGKQAWLLEYNNEAHNLTERRNMKDLSKRLQQFFDYYLQGAPQPAWMKYGIPATRKGQYFGFENAE